MMTFLTVAFVSFWRTAFLLEFGIHLCLPDHGDTLLENGGGPGNKFVPCFSGLDVSTLVDEIEGMVIVSEANAKGEVAILLACDLRVVDRSELLLQNASDLLHDVGGLLVAVDADVVVFDVAFDVRF